MYWFFGFLYCAKYLFPMSSKLQEYVVMQQGRPASLANYFEISPSLNPHANFRYFPKRREILIGRSSVGNGLYRSPVYEGNGEWEVEREGDAFIRLKNGPWCLGVRKEMLLIEENALVLANCGDIPEQLFFLYDDKY